jgi:hypothetical protein
MAGAALEIHGKYQQKNNPRKIGEKEIAPYAVGRTH